MPTPTAPTGVTATPGDAAADVSWPAVTAVPAVTSYTVTPYLGAVAQTTVAATSTSVTVSGLTNGSAYTFTVKATNTIGTSPESAASAAVTPLATFPDPPTGVTATAGAGSALVSWTAVTATPALTRYNVTPYLNGVALSPVPVVGNPPAAPDTSVQVAGLAAGSSYTFTVSATNSNGTSVDSAPSAAVTTSPPVVEPDPVCSLCKYWDPTGVSNPVVQNDPKRTVVMAAQGLCRVAAPAILSVRPGRQTNVAIWPVCLSTDWCGQFEYVKGTD